MGLRGLEYGWIARRALGFAGDFISGEMALMRAPTRGVVARLETKRLPAESRQVGLATESRLKIPRIRVDYVDGAVFPQAETSRPLAPPHLSG